MFKKAVVSAVVSVLVGGAHASLPDANAFAQKGSFVQVAARDIAASVSAGSDLMGGSEPGSLENTGHGNRQDEPEQTPAAQAPKTYALMLAGLGAMGFILRRRRD